MRTLRWVGVVLLLAVPSGRATADAWRKDNDGLRRINPQLHGKIVDYTANSGIDNRIWSRSLWQRRDMYVYLPPGYNPHERYPLMIWLHGFYDDEQSFAEHIAPAIDEAIACGKLPPLIVAAPDGSLRGEPCLKSAGSFFLNSDAGTYADYVLQDVWDFLCLKYPIRSEREAHVLAGMSMGGLAAYNFAIKHREAFGVVAGVFPVLNWRWQDQHGHYQAQFNPYDWGWLMDMGHGLQVIARYSPGMTVRIGEWVGPLFGVGPDAVARMALENPIEMLERYKVAPGELEMYVAYTGRDEFNIDAQVESFLYTAQLKGLPVGVGYDALGRHTMPTAKRLLPGLIYWLAPRIAPYTPAAAGSDDCIDCEFDEPCPPPGCAAGCGDGCAPQAPPVSLPDVLRE